MKIEKTIQIPCGQTYLIKMNSGGYIEAGDVFMSQENGVGTRPYHFSDFESPSDTNKRVMTISTMVGCPCHCRFCSSRKSFLRNLTPDEIVNQVTMMVEEGQKYGRNSDPNNAKEFRVLFTRMGEPMLNAKNVIQAIKKLIELYPNIVIGMSTSGYATGVKEFLAHPEILPYIDMQFSIHSTNQKERDWLFDTESNMTFFGISKYAHEWFEKTGKKVGLNIILFDGFTYNFNTLLHYFDKDKIWIRLSPWNVVTNVESDFAGLLKTEDVLDKKPVTSESLKAIMKSLDKTGISYSYAPAIDEEVKHKVACGQALEIFKDILN